MSLDYLWIPENVKGIRYFIVQQSTYLQTKDEVESHEEGKKKEEISHVTNAFKASYSTLLESQMNQVNCNSTSYLPIPLQQLHA